MESDGILLIDKDFGLTSADAVQRVRRICRNRKVGHTGTLDPYATGLLIVTLGRATKITAYLGGQHKSYSAKIKLGETRDTYDRYGLLLQKSDARPEHNKIEEALKEFLGKTMQAVPPHSATHFEGKRLYEYARRGEEIPEIKKSVEISRLEIGEFAWPLLEINIDCSAGTYIRSLAHQLGETLGCGGHLYSLRRTAIGKFRAANALTLLQLEALVKMELYGEYLIPIQNALSIPAILVDDPRTEKIKHGRDIMRTDVMGLEKEFVRGDIIGIKNASGHLLAVGTALFSSRECCATPAAGAKVFEYKRVI